MFSSLRASATNLFLLPIAILLNFFFTPFLGDGKDNKYIFPYNYFFSFIWGVPARSLSFRAKSRNLSAPSGFTLQALLITTKAFHCNPITELYYLNLPLLRLACIAWYYLFVAVFRSEYKQVKNRSKQIILSPIPYPDLFYLVYVCQRIITN